MPIFKHNGQIIYFAHVPRCGGSSIEDYLLGSFGQPAFLDRRHRARKRRAWGRTSPQHIAVRQLGQLFPEDFFDHAFAIVRDPVERLRSAFHFQRDVEKSLPDGMSFAAFAEELRRPAFRRNPVFDNHFRLQSELVPEGATVFRYEDGLDAVCAHIDALSGQAPGTIGLKHALKTLQPKEAVSAEADRAIREICSEDCDRFGYHAADDRPGPTTRRARSGVTAIRTGVPDPDGQESWGDYHFARSLAKAIERAGHKARVDVKSDWDSAPDDDSLDIVLQGHDWHRRRDGVPGLIWLIYPGKRFETSWLADYDHVFVGSEVYADKLVGAHPDLRLSILHQAFDSDRMMPGAAPRSDDLVFVGNNHFGHDRPMAVYARTGRHGLKIWGRGWDDPVWSAHVQAERVANEDLGQLYGTARAVLCDHTKPMARNGFLSNRIFDALACAAPVISDGVAGLHEMFAPFIEIADDQTSFDQAVANLTRTNTPTASDRQDFARQMAREHSFDARARAILNQAEELSLL